MNLMNYEKNTKVHVRKFKNDFYLLGNGKGYRLNYVGAVVIKYLHKDMEISELSGKIASYYGIEDTEQIAADICNFLNFLIQNNLVHKHV